MTGIMLPAYIENVSTRKDKTVKITLGTQELSPDKAGQLFSVMNSLSVVYISKKDIDQQEIDIVDKVNPEFGTKTQSQRLRAVFYKLYEQAPEGFKDFNTYYQSKMEAVITHYKNKIQ
jgi:hypothetical protein